MAEHRVGGAVVHEIERIAEEETEDGYEAACRQLLHLMRRHVGMEVAWTSEFVGTHQVFRMVDCAEGLPAPVVGTSTPLNDAYCSRVLLGSMPALIPNVRDEATAAWLDVTTTLQIGSYLGVPLHGADGAPNGMLCAVSAAASVDLSEQDLTTARLVAQVIDELHHRALGAGAARRERTALRRRIRSACRGVGRSVVLQPLVDLATGDAVAAEVLSRFADQRRTPSGWFAAAYSVGLGPELEVAAARSALTLLSDATMPTVAVNLSPDVVLVAADELFAGVDVSRVVLELTEYAPVADYDRLEAALCPHRAAGLRVAVDDAGAGFASMTHVLRLRPDLVKIDMSLVRDVDTDPVRQALIGALVRFAAALGAGVVAEGVETSSELAVVADLGVGLAQGHVFGVPTEQPAWAGYGQRARGPATGAGVAQA